MKRKLQKILMILTSCGLMLTTAGCGTSQTADTDTTDTITQNEEDTTGASGTTKEKDADTDTDSKETVAAEDGGAEGETDDNTDEESGLAQTTDTAKTGTGVATTSRTASTTSQKPAASGNSGTAGTTTSGTATTEATSGSGTSSAKDSSSGTSATTHTHNWVAVYKTVNHPEEGHYETVEIVSPWEIYEEHTVCSRCRFDYTANGVTPGDCPNCDLAGWTTVSVGTGEYQVFYEDQWVVDVAAYSEQVVDYYRCSECGQTK